MINPINKLKLNKNRIENILIVLLFLLLTFIFSLNSPLNIWEKSDVGTDSSVFKNVAFLMTKGYMPYRDTFDHKGPLIYLINFLGIYISYYRGVWILELITLFTTFLFLYKICRLCSRKFISVATTLLAVSLLFEYYEGGNLVEEYAMPLIAISMYIYMDYFLNQKITNLRLILCGSCFGAVCMLRPNMISLWGVFCITVFILCIKEKCFLKLRQFILFFAIGFCLIVLPLIFWLLINDAFNAFIDNYISFNTLYSSAEGGRAVLSAKWNSFFHFLNNTVILLTLAATIYLYKAKDKFLYGSYILYLLCTLLLMCMSGKAYGHYGMILIPAVVFPISSFLGALVSKQETTEKVLTSMVVTYILASIVLPNWLTAAGEMISLYENREEDHLSTLVTDVCKYVTRNTSSNEKISVYGNWNIIYILSYRVSASKYSYQVPIGSVLPSIMDEYFAELKDTMPSLIIIQPGKKDSQITEFLTQNNYVEVYSSNPGSSNSALIYQLAD